MKDRLKKRRMWRWPALAAVLALALVVAGCGGDEEAAEEGEPAATEPVAAEETADIQERELSFAYITPETFPYHDGAVRFKELVEERSDGKITVTLFPGAQLGGERDIEEGILEGSIHFGIGAGALAAFSPIMNLLELPFLIKNQEHMQAIIDSPVADELSSRIEDGGFEVLDWFSTGDSAIQTVDKAIRQPSDLNGVKIRVIENPALVDALNALGANATPLPYPEIYNAMQQEVIEGSHVDWGSVTSLKLYELIEFSTGPEVAFLAEPRPVIASVEFWSSLSADEQELIQTAMQEAAEHERQVFLEKQQTAIETVEAEGVTLTEIDEEAFASKLEGVYEKWAQELDAAELIEQIEELRP